MIVESSPVQIAPFIVDASVAAKWLFDDEDLLAEARSVRISAESLGVALGAPDILWAELGHALVRAVRHGRIDGMTAQTLSGELVDLRPLVSDIRVDPRDAVRVALTVGVSAYDAQYLALGSALGAPVLTADAGMYDRGRAHGFEVAWLGDLARPEADTPQGYR